MKLSLLALAAPLLALPLALPTSGATPASALAFHCQIPCGIYGDKLRIDLLMEDAATIGKGMKMLGQADVQANKNQMVRWVMNKDQHAQNIQDQVAAYWLAQRIKVPAEGADAAAVAKYHQQLGLMHRITVAAMKCKQTTDIVHVTKLRELALEFSGTYFGGAELEHINEHHGAHGDDF